ncbi:hypothetical protein ACLKA7_015659 [Drosophila subpalustris]
MAEWSKALRSGRSLLCRQGRHGGTFCMSLSSIISSWQHLMKLVAAVCQLQKVEQVMVAQLHHQVWNWPCSMLSAIQPHRESEAISVHATTATTTKPFTFLNKIA